MKRAPPFENKLATPLLWRKPKTEMTVLLLLLLLLLLPCFIIVHLSLLLEGVKWFVLTFSLVLPLFPQTMNHALDPVQTVQFPRLTFSAAAS